MRFRDVEIGPDGYIYFSTEVRYGSGQPDGTVIRLEPAGDPLPAPTRNSTSPGIGGCSTSAGTTSA